MTWALVCSQNPFGNSLQVHVHGVLEFSLSLDVLINYSHMSFGDVQKDG